MGSIPGFVGYSIYESPSGLDRRQQGCVQCENKQPDCPQCADDEYCNVSIPMNCRECPSASCLKDPSKVGGSAAAPPPAASQPPNGGAIAGAVIGGLAVIAVATYLVWRFCIKNRRGEYEEQWYDEAQSKEGMGGDAATHRSKRNSSHTVHSIASTVLTRASNIIQIAYIPGVTNRAQANDPNVLVPPVPPIPLAHSEHAGKRAGEDEQHFFVPGNLRDSTYSGISTNTDRTSYAARSYYAPRSSVASTIYGKNAVVSPTPAQRGNFLKPSLVSVKSRNGSEKSAEAPPVPAVNYEKYEQQPPPPSPAFSIGATFFKNASASTAQTARPQVVRVGSNGPKEVEVKPKPSAAPSTTSDAESGEAKSAQDGGKTGAEASTSEAPSAAGQSPFIDPPSTPSSSKSERQNSHKRNISTGDLSRPKAEPVREASPFGDQHAVKDS